MYAMNMMEIAVEIALNDPSFEDLCTKFYEHFVLIAEALNGLDLWSEQDGFFYDVLSLNGERVMPLSVRSIVGLTPLFAVSTISHASLKKLDDFQKRMDWFKEYRINNEKFLPNEESSAEACTLLSLVHRDRLGRLLEKLLDEKEFLSGYGIRALSKYHEENPYLVMLDGTEYLIRYDPGDSTSGLFGGNSNWRGPIWMPINYLLIKSLEKFGAFYRDDLKVECPTGSGKQMNLTQVAVFLKERLLNIIKPANGNVPLYGPYNWFYKGPDAGLFQFHEYFHGDSGRGLGASHQTGWTALFVDLIS
jgi:Glycosyl hydrolase family 63 C-terminal domain